MPFFKYVKQQLIKFRLVILAEAFSIEQTSEKQLIEICS